MIIIMIIIMIIMPDPVQVGVGLEYLHERNILYRDLKSDNILVVTMDPTAAVNVKISDYGISKFTTSQGMMGMVGTPGYMAPEIMEGQAYNEKVVERVLIEWVFFKVCVIISYILVVVQ